MTGPLIVGIHPTVRGFAWVVCTSANHALEWGMTYQSPITAVAASLKQARSILERFRPEVIAIEDWSERRGLHRQEIEPFLEGIAALGAELGIALAVHRRHEIRRALGLQPNATRQDIMKVVMDRMRAFSHRAPKKREAWDSTDRRLSLFCAAAAVLTAYRHEGFDHAYPDV